MTNISFGPRIVVASGALVVPVGSDRADFNLAGNRVTVVFDELALTSQVKSTGPQSAEIQIQKMGHGGFAYFDGKVGGLSFAIAAQRFAGQAGAYVDFTYTFTT